MLQRTIVDLFSNVWPTLFLFAIIASSLRITYLINNKIKFVLYKELFMLGFILYLLFLFYVVTFQDVDWGSSNLIPLKEIMRYKFGSRLFIKNILGNVLLFVPYGFFVGYYIKASKGRIALSLCLITSFSIEITQLLIGRVFDIDDILLNIIGGMIGFYVYFYIDKIRNCLPSFFRSNLFNNICVIIIIILIILYLFNFISVGGIL